LKILFFQLFCLIIRRPPLMVEEARFVNDKNGHGKQKGCQDIDPVRPDGNGIAPEFRLVIGKCQGQPEDYRNDNQPHGLKYHAGGGLFELGKRFRALIMIRRQTSQSKTHSNRLKVMALTLLILFRLLSTSSNIKLAMMATKGTPINLSHLSFS